MSKIYYKGFDKDFKCRGFQFEAGKTYTHKGEAKACSSGFHSCENPWDVLNYYDITQRFAIVEIGGDTSTHNYDSKIASAEITIKAELKLPEFIASAIKWIKDQCNTVSGDSSKLAASGYSSQLAASGDSSKLAASGYSSQLAASGDSSQLAASGDSSVAMCCGEGSKAKAGKNGAVALTRWVESEGRYRISVGYIGEDLKENTWYALDDQGNFIEVE